MSVSSCSTVAVKALEDKQKLTLESTISNHYRYSSAAEFRTDFTAERCGRLATSVFYRSWRCERPVDALALRDPKHTRAAGSANPVCLERLHRYAALGFVLVAGSCDAMLRSECVTLAGSIGELPQHLLEPLFQHCDAVQLARIEDQCRYPRGAIALGIVVVATPSNLCTHLCGGFRLEGRIQLLQLSTHWERCFREEFGPPASPPEVSGCAVDGAVPFCKQQDTPVKHRTPLSCCSAAPEPLKYQGAVAEGPMEASL